jgi:hypothetical protein
MLIFWIRKSKTGEQNCPQGNDQDSFQKHDEDMKRFFLSHPQIETTAAKDIITADGNVLAAVQKVKLTKHVQN